MEGRGKRESGLGVAGGQLRIRKAREPMLRSADCPLR